MPFVATTIQYPVAGKSPESRAILEARVKALQVAGIEANLGVLQWGPDYPAYFIGQRFATLADFESTRAARADTNFAPSLGPLSRRPLMTTLSERLQATSPSSAPVKWTRWNTYAAAVGKAQELRALLLQRGEEFESDGITSNLSVQVAGTEAGLFTRVFVHSSLAELEERRVAAATSASNSAFLQKLNPLLSRPLDVTIRETLIPYPQ